MRRNARMEIGVHVVGVGSGFWVSDSSIECGNHVFEK